MPDPILLTASDAELDAILESTCRTYWRNPAAGNRWYETTYADGRRILAEAYGRRGSIQVAVVEVE